MEEQGDRETWSVVYTRAAIDFIMAEVHSQRVADKLFSYRELLEAVPDLGRAYDPSYPAARPPFPCRYAAVPDTPFLLFYLKDEENRRLIVFCIEYQRVDPSARFSGMPGIDW